MRRRHQSEYTDPAEEPLVSVIIATYNRGKILVDRTLPSILEQTYRNLEVIIVGDHCADNTPQLLAKVNDPRVRFHDLPCRGVYPDDVTLRWFVQGTAPRNTGMALARGKWLAWLSDDDVFTPTHLETLISFAIKEDCEFVSAAYEEERYGEKRILGSKEGIDAIGAAVGGMPTWLYRSYLRLFKWNIHSWRKSWNRPVDYDLVIRMIKAGVRIGYTDEVVTWVPPVDGTQTVGLEALKTLDRETRA